MSDQINLLKNKEILDMRMENIVCARLLMFSI